MYFPLFIEVDFPLRPLSECRLLCHCLITHRICLGIGVKGQSVCRVDVCAHTYLVMNTNALLIYSTLMVTALYLASDCNIVLKLFHP